MPTVNTRLSRIESVIEARRSAAIRALVLWVFDNVSLDEARAYWRVFGRRTGQDDGGVFGEPQPDDDDVADRIDASVPDELRARVLRACGVRVG